MKKEHINELQSMIEEYLKNHHYERKHLFAFFHIVYVGLMESQGMSQEDMNEMCDKMKLEFKIARSLRNE